MITNYFFAEQAIITNLLGIASLKGVWSFDDAYKTSEFFQKPTPCAYVIYAGDKIGDSSGNGAAHIIRQEWVVALADRRMTDTTGEKTRQTTGEILLDIISKMSGFQPHEQARPFNRIQGDPVIYMQGGLMIIPTHWETLFSLGRR